MQLQQLERMPDGAADTQAAAELGGLTSLQAFLSHPQVTTATVTTGGVSGPFWPDGACTWQGGLPTAAGPPASQHVHTPVCGRTQCSFQNKSEYGLEWKPKQTSFAYIQDLTL